LIGSIQSRGCFSRLPRSGLDLKNMKICRIEYYLHKMKESENIDFSKIIKRLELIKTLISLEEEEEIILRFK